MAQHAAHARPTHRRAIVAGAAVVAVVAIGASAAAAWSSAPAPASCGGLAPAFATALQAGIDDVRSACAVERARTSPSPSLPQADAPSTTRASYAPALADLAALPGQADPFAFCFDPDSADAAPSLSETSAARLQEARDAFAARGWDAGYLLVDLETGCGLAGNLDVTAYGASTFKAPYALYLCETQLDTELAALDTPCFEAPATAFMDPTGTYLYDGLASYPLGTLIADSVTQSDNDSYRILRASYDAAGFSAWIADRGLPASLTDDWFPTYSARTSGMLWLLMAQYLDGDAASAAWLSELLGQSETSFLRNVLPPEATVRGKAGWYADDDPAFCGVCDAGIVSAGGRDYLVCAMSTAPFSADGQELLENLLAAAFDARDDLG